MSARTDPLPQSTRLDPDAWLDAGRQCRNFTRWTYGLSRLNALMDKTSSISPSAGSSPATNLDSGKKVARRAAYECVPTAPSRHDGRCGPRRGPRASSRAHGAVRAAIPTTGAGAHRSPRLGRDRQQRLAAGRGHRRLLEPRRRHRVAHQPGLAYQRAWRGRSRPRAASLYCS